MLQNNSNNDSKQENQHQPNYITPAVNSSNETGRKESGKAGDSPEEPPEKVVGTAKYVKPSPKRKVLRQRKNSMKKRLSISSSSEFEKIKRKRSKKKRLGRKKKRKSPSSSSNLSSSNSTTNSESEAESDASVKPLDVFIKSLLPSKTVRPSNGKITAKNCESNGPPFIPFMERVRGQP